MGAAPKIAIMVFINEPGGSPNISLKIVPATTTEVRAGINRVDRKKFLPIVNLLLSQHARIMGIGINKIKVKTVYIKLFLIAKIKVGFNNS